LKCNESPVDRVIRAVVGTVLVVVGLASGGWAWWGILLDIFGALLLLSAVTGFCHVYKTFGNFGTARKR